MSIEYITGGHTFSFDYQRLKQHYQDACAMTDDVFLNSLPSILHLSCIICYIKGASLNETLGDMGIIHELAHLIHLPDEGIISITAIRELFEKICKLA